MGRNAKLKGWVVPGLLLGTMAYALAEEITLTTYYPSPRGVYDELRTAGNVQIGSLDAPAIADPVPRLHLVQGEAAPALRVDDEAPVGSLLDATPFLIDASGNVGLGTAGPGKRLHVEGNDLYERIRLRSTAIGGTAGLELLGNNAAAGAGWTIANDGGADPMLQFLNSSGALVAAMKGGNVGIGTTNPGQKLTVAGTIESTVGGVKFPDGTTQATAAAPHGKQRFTANGTFTVPAGVTTVWVSMSGGGGGGGGGGSSVGGGGGGADAVLAESLTVTSGSAYTITVGAGGTNTNASSDVT